MILSEEQKSRVSEEVIKIANAPPLSKDQLDFDPQNPDTLTIPRRIQKKKDIGISLVKILIQRTNSYYARKIILINYPS